jgi:hypothetical protein
MSERTKRKHKPQNTQKLNKKTGTKNETHKLIDDDDQPARIEFPWQDIRRRAREAQLALEE